MSDDVIKRLDGQWKLYYFPQGEFSFRGPEELEGSGLQPIEAAVPRNVELDLLKAEIINDPYKGDNIKSLKKYETYEWWYVKEFTAEDINSCEKAGLVFRGVDCFADYWLNGELLGESDNALIEHSFDITGRLDPVSANKLVIRLRSPIIEAMKHEYCPSMSAFTGNWENLWVRKAPHCYGWDIMPRAVSAGIWRSVDIEAYSQYLIEDLYFVTRAIKEERAKLAIYFNISVNPCYFGRLRLVVQGNCDGCSFENESAVYFSSGVTVFEIEKPCLWWSRGYGNARLYEVNASLVLDGEVLACKSFTTGIRTIELISESTSGKGVPGSFYFKINGEPVMCKGSNWVPADAFHSRDAQRYEKMLELFRDLNCNMIRCWGGNVYEDHEFFDFCDRNGIMVWQDFAMACGSYPQDEAFFKAIEKEVASVVKKLRRHPSLVVWCGDNECDYDFFNNGIDPDNNRITREIIPQQVLKHDPYRPFYTTSPYFSPEIAALGEEAMAATPEAHLWGPRDYYKSSYYTGSKAGFVGEIGYHGCPNLSSIKSFIDGEYLWPWWNNPQWITHCTAPSGKTEVFSYRIELMADQIKEMFGFIPEDIENFIIASQISQAEAKKFFIEMSRIKKWKRSGILWWNVIDGWPQFSDAVVDYYFGKKLAYHYIRRVQEPVCVMLDEPENWYLRIMAGNDTLRNTELSFKIWDADSLEILYEGAKSLKPNSNNHLGSIRISRGEQRLFLMEWEHDGRRCVNHYLHGHPPFSLERYIRWLGIISALDNSYEASCIGK